MLLSLLRWFLGGDVPAAWLAVAREDAGLGDADSGVGLVGKSAGGAAGGIGVGVGDAA